MALANPHAAPQYEMLQAERHAYIDMTNMFLNKGKP